jgi:GR25 family glycosyltransferase involved in LPS biosynthesis
MFNRYHANPFCVNLDLPRSIMNRPHSRALRNQVQKNEKNDVKSSQNPICCYVINLARRPDRLSAFKKAIQQSALEPVLIQAIDGKDLSTDQIANCANPWFIQNFTGEKLRGVVGCSLSHMKVWEIISESEQKYHLIFEDDARPVNKVALMRLSPLLQSIPADAHLVWLNTPSDLPVSLVQRALRWGDRNLHTSGIRRKLLSLYDNIRYRLLKPAFVCCSIAHWHTAEAYIITPETAQKLVLTFKHRFSIPDNDLLVYSKQKKVNTYRSTYPIFEQNKQLATDIDFV